MGVLRGILSAVVGGFAASLLVVPLAHADDENEWLKDFFEKDVVLDNRTNPDAGKRKDVAGQFIEALSRFSKLRFISPNDSRSFSQNMQRLVGNYVYLDDKKVIRLIGRGSYNRNVSVDLKDSLVFRGIVKRNIGAQLKLPFLSVDASNKKLSELKILDNAVVQSDASADQIACGFPISHLARAKKRQYYFITAATASSIETTAYDKNKQAGSAAFSIINLAGDNFYANESTQRQIVISVSIVETIPLDVTKPGIARQCEKIMSGSVTRSGFESLASRNTALPKGFQGQKVYSVVEEAR